MHICMVQHVKVFENDRPPVVGVIPLKPEDKGVLFNRVKKASESLRQSYFLRFRFMATVDGG